MFEPITKKISLKDQVIITVNYDYYDDGPRAWDNVWSIYTFLRNYKSPDPHNYNDFNSCIYEHTGLTNELVALLNFEEIKRLVEQNGYFLEYIDYNIGYYTATYYIDDNPSDDQYRDQLGVAIVKKGFEGMTHDQLISRLEGELEIYNEFANGHVYCFSIESFGNKYNDDSLCSIYLPSGMYPDDTEGLEYILNTIGGYDFNPDNFIDYNENILISLLKKKPRFKERKK